MLDSLVVLYSRFPFIVVFKATAGTIEDRHVVSGHAGTRRR